jgi:hypothetical protein
VFTGEQTKTGIADHDRQVKSKQHYNIGYHIYDDICPFTFFLYFGGMYERALSNNRRAYGADTLESSIAEPAKLPKY